MYYCQDCGGANPANASTCRICGLQIIRERGGSPCQSCGSPTVVNARFCSLCGTATVTTATVTVAEPRLGAVQVDAIAAEDRVVSATSNGGTINLGEGLELPDWLKRAAAEQPLDPSRQSAITANPFGPATGSTATLTAAPPTVTGGGPPNGDGFAPPGHFQRAASSDDVDALAAAAPVPIADVADTSTFISEDDLPDWIRQLAAADEAKKADELQRAAEAAAAASKPAATADPRPRRPLPGETATTGPATSPWLTRRERAEGPETVAADSWGAPAAPDTAPAWQETRSEPVTIPASAPEVKVAEHAPTPTTSPAAKQPNQLRLVLMAAVVLLVVALVAFMALS